MPRRKGTTPPSPARRSSARGECYRKMPYPSATNVADQILLQTPDAWVRIMTLDADENGQWHRHSEVAEHVVCLSGGARPRMLRAQRDHAASSGRCGSRRGRPPPPRREQQPECSALSLGSGSGRVRLRRGLITCRPIRSPLPSVTSFEPAADCGIRPQLCPSDTTALGKSPEFGGDSPRHGRASPRPCPGCIGRYACGGWPYTETGQADCTSAWVVGARDACGHSRPEATRGATGRDIWHHASHSRRGFDSRRSPCAACPLLLFLQ